MKGFLYENHVHSTCPFTSDQSRNTTRPSKRSFSAMCVAFDMHYKLKARLAAEHSYAM